MGAPARLVVEELNAADGQECPSSGKNSVYKQSQAPIVHTARRDNVV